MKLYEYQGRDLLQSVGIPVPRGVLVSSSKEALKRQDEIPFPCVAKAQVLAGGRGKAGGIRKVGSPQELEGTVESILRMTIQGMRVPRVLLVEHLSVKKEFYLSAILDRGRREVLLLFSTEGGVEIESVPDEKVRRIHVHPTTRFSPYHARLLFDGLGLEASVRSQLEEMTRKLLQAFFEFDAELAEINPLVCTSGGELVAADAKFVLDDDARFRHPNIEEPAEDKTPLEREAEEKGISFIEMPGDIGVIANGAGLTMATLDAIHHFGGRPGIFLDLGGTDDPHKVRECVLLMKKANPKVMLLNLFGGITKSDTVALGLKMVLDEEKIPFPIVTRIRGVHEEEARQILQEAGLYTARTLSEAARLTVEIRNALVGGLPLPSRGGG